MSPTRRDRPATAPALPVWWLVQVAGDLDLPGLREAAVAAAAAGVVTPAPDPDGRGAALLAQAQDVLLRAGLPADHPELPAAARALAALGGTWRCPALPWQPSHAPCAALTLDPRLRLQPAPEHRGGMQAQAVALLLALGAFDDGWPAHVRPLAGPGGVSAPGGAIRLLAMSPLDGQAAAAHDPPADGPQTDLGPTTAEETVLAQLAVRLQAIGAQADIVAVIDFDIDDQSPEDLAIGLQRVREQPGVLGASWSVAGGKKGRPSFAIEVLARPDAAAEAIESCLRHTSTIGLRWRLERRVLLARQAGTADSADGRTGRIKTVTRPGGQCTTKVEADDVDRQGRDLADRAAWRAELEARRRP